MELGSGELFSPGVSRAVAVRCQVKLLSSAGSTGRDDHSGACTWLAAGAMLAVSWAPGWGCQLERLQLHLGLSEHGSWVLRDEESCKALCDLVSKVQNVSSATFYYSRK